MLRTLSTTLIVITSSLVLLVGQVEAQNKKTWTTDNIKQWIDSKQQKQEKRELLRTMTPHDRQEYSQPSWFVPPQMSVNTSQIGQLGRLEFPAYKIIKILNEHQAVIEVTDPKGHRYMIVFDLGDTSELRLDHRAHISPKKYSLFLFQRTDNFLYRDSQNIRRALPAFKKLDPSEIN